MLIMNIKFWKKQSSMKKNKIKIGNNLSPDKMVGLTDFCLICLSPGYNMSNIQDDNHFYIHNDCFGYVNRYGELILRFKDANEVYEKNKDNIDTVISLRKKYKMYIEKRNKELKLSTNMEERI